MTKSIQQLLDEKPLLFTKDISEIVKEWLTQYKKMYEEMANELDKQHRNEDYALTMLQRDTIEDLIEDLKHE